MREPRERIRLTLLALSYWRTVHPNLEIVICDGSDHDLEEEIRSAGLGSKNKIEVLHFQNDIEAVRQLGKGYGEGEIVRFAIHHSEFLQRSDVFAKCTSRHWVTNFGCCLRSFNHVAGFDYQGRRRPVLIDTRFYITRKDFYVKYLEDGFLSVNENKQVNLEHVFRDRLCKLRPNQYLLSTVPHIHGMSGSMGKIYQPARSKTILRSIRNRFVRTTGIFP